MRHDLVMKLFYYLILMLSLIFAKTIFANECPTRIVYFNQNTIPDTNDAACIDAALSIGGHALFAGKDTGMMEFLSATGRDIEQRLDNYIKNKHISVSEVRHVMLDIEHPVHPRQFHRHYKDRKWLDIVEAFKLRIESVSNMFPGAKLTLYGIIAPSNRCDKKPIEARIDPLVSAHENGLSDNLYKYGAVLYLRNSLDEETEAISSLCLIDKFDAIRQTVSGVIPVNSYMPLLSMRIYSSQSSKNRTNVGDDDIVLLNSQIQRLKRLGFKEVGVWHPDNEQSADWDAMSVIRKIQFRF